MGVMDGRCCWFLAAPSGASWSFLGASSHFLGLLGVFQGLLERPGALGFPGPSGVSWVFLGPPWAYLGLLEFPEACRRFLIPSEVSLSLLGLPDTFGLSWDPFASPGASLGPPGASCALPGVSGGFLGFLGSHCIKQACRI